MQQKAPKQTCVNKETWEYMYLEYISQNIQGWVKVDLQL